MVVDRKRPIRIGEVGAVEKAEELDSELGDTLRCSRWL
jgi:hypothetical protein